MVVLVLLIVDEGGRQHRRRLRGFTGRARTSQ